MPLAWLSVLIVLLEPPSRDARWEAMECYANCAEAAYAASAASAATLSASVRAFCMKPDQRSLERARAAWCEARRAYGRTETFRFGDGPIDARRGGVETFVNAWPVDENFIEPAPGAARTGIIADRARYPLLARTVLREHNQRGGETNVCTGWHAIEFMLWGRDASVDGPGDRAPADFEDGTPDADRRREFLLEITLMLQEDLERVAGAWRAGTGSYRERFLASPAKAVRAMFSGPALLSGFEMSGERLAVALETREQEEETSCFSDFTDSDFKANLQGIDHVLRGDDACGGLIALVRASDPARADSLEFALRGATSAVCAMPHPFDAAIRAPKGDARHEALVSAMQSLERLSEQIALSAKALGTVLPSQPQG